MHRRQFLQHLGGAALAAPVLLSCASRRRPNILLILSDDAGYADFGFQGSTDMLTPNLDRLAENGIIFTDAHVTATVCSPSRAGLLTGRYQQRFGHEANAPGHGQGMDPAETTLAAALKQMGYATGIFGKWHLGDTEEYHPNDRGFDEFFGMLGGSRSYFFSGDRNRRGGPRMIMHNREPSSFEGYYTDVLADRTCDFIERHQDRPWFAFLSFTAVHTPMQAKQEDLDLFRDHSRPVLAAMTKAMDDGVGRVTDMLKQRGLMQNTLIIFTNDNGGAAFNTSSNWPLKGWKGNKFEGGQRVPFFLHWPGHIEPGRIYGELTSTLDIFATAVAAAGGGYAGGKPLDGVNLLPYIAGSKKDSPHDLLFWRKEDEAAVRWKNWKLIRLDNYGTVLYDLDANPEETGDLKKSHPDIHNKMMKALENWETEMAESDWHEENAWRQVTREIHEALMENRTPKRIQP